MFCQFVYDYMYLQKHVNKHMNRSPRGLKGFKPATDIIQADIDGIIGAAHAASY